MKSPAFSNFRSELDRWEEAQKKLNLNDLIENSEFCLFFTFEKEVYAADEHGRLTFAKMKSKDEDKAWIKEATFQATNLSKSVNGEQTERLFGVKDLSKIKIIDQEEAEKKI